MNIIPLPTKVQENAGFIALGRDSAVTGAFDKTKTLLKKFLSDREGGADCNVLFAIDESLQEEEYRIDCEVNKVIVGANSENGAFYALVTLQQIFTKDGLPSVNIEDKPNYKYRGFSLDCARHFWRVEKIKQILDVMSHIKMNEFHWHLTDDQGWRVQLKKYPLLTQKGTIRKRTPLSPKAFMGSGDWGYDENE